MPKRYRLEKGIAGENTGAGAQKPAEAHSADKGLRHRVKWKGSGPNPGRTGEGAGLRENSPQENTLLESALRESAMQENALQENALLESALRESAMQENALQESALQENALRESALQESALQENAMRESALRESAMRESALRESALQENAGEENGLVKEGGKKNRFHGNIPPIPHFGAKINGHGAAVCMAQNSGEEALSPGGPEKQRLATSHFAQPLPGAGPSPKQDETGFPDQSHRIEAEWAGPVSRLWAGVCLTARRSKASLRRLAGRGLWPLAAPLGLGLAIVLSGFGSFARTCAAVRESTLRLHVVANSDSESDQAVKLAVRDEILARFGPVFARAQGRQEAEKAAATLLPEIESLAREVLAARGCGDVVAVRVTREYFPTTKYSTLTMPAGQYHALRVELGRGAGHNWWCVLYPPLCLPAACVDGAYPAGEQVVLAGGYEVRFAALEWLEWARNRFAAAEEQAPA